MKDRELVYYENDFGGMEKTRPVGEFADSLLCDRYDLGEGELETLRRDVVNLREGVSNLIQVLTNKGLLDLGDLKQILQPIENLLRFSDEEEPDDGLR